MAVQYVALSPHCATLQDNIEDNTTYMYMYDSLFFFLFQDRMNNINQLADDFVANDHFNADAIDNKRKSVAERFAALQEPLKAREEKLNDALKLQQYFRYSHMKMAGVVR